MIYFRLFHLPTFATTLRSTVNSEVDFLFLSFSFFHLKLQDGNQPTLRASDSCDFLSCIYSSKIPSRTLNMQTMTNYNLNESITSPSLDELLPNVLENISSSSSHHRFYHKHRREMAWFASFCEDEQGKQCFDIISSSYSIPGSRTGSESHKSHMPRN